MFDKLKDEAEVIPGATCPRTGKLPFQLVRLELWMKGVGRKQLQRQLQFRSESRVFFSEAPRGTNKGLGGKEQAFQARMRLTICFGVAGRQRPPSNSRRADCTAWSRVSRRRSARRCCKTSTSDSCSSTPNSSAESNTCANVFMAAKIGRFIRECKRLDRRPEPSMRPQTRRARQSLQSRRYAPISSHRLDSTNWETPHWPARSLPCWQWQPPH